MRNIHTGHRMHTKLRAEERFGISLNRHKYAEMTRLIRDQSKRARFVDRQSLEVTRWFVYYENQWLPVVYDKKRKTIKTVLPQDELGPLPTDIP